MLLEEGESVFRLYLNVCHEISPNAAHTVFRSVVDACLQVMFEVDNPVADMATVVQPHCVFTS
ncbi:hypothetical protein WI42_12955 [Burkholderia ubonensis]|uniref:Uncharacterized protein n=1 Tax=Burkholderia ubonensis TaxID=101571 RepID=A0A102MYL2_9BURK|nr:hypothetical protein WI35_11705 [Burkholderia ubonensis]KUZ87394.1 hypothetical protein WI38_21360 [Burkholderia ubonensis]KUZ95218.1 hypothetical protein WI39_14160 [Burkholderia ubonensis]KVA13772.1 hypothetical protein WI43_25780 [Burkholderia ubonensis]KVA20626.1 hypothetical protein WI42_12955 [Burkholderia ubonensis]